MNTPTESAATLTSSADRAKAMVGSRSARIQGPDDDELPEDRDQAGDQGGRGGGARGGEHDGEGEVLHLPSYLTRRV
ncbi:MAG: hypothetical protein WCK58_09555 [Chloroflexota bacterium]